jgi:dTDP-4-dehydrorhamnose reductase
LGNFRNGVSKVQLLTLFLKEMFLTEFIVALIVRNEKAFGVYHYCDNKIMTWFSFAEHILYENNLKDKINLFKSSNYITLAKRPKYSVLCTKTTKI